MTLWVVKIGTSLLRGTKEYSTEDVIGRFSSCIAESKRRGDKVILVTSGAVGIGCHRLGIKERPEDLTNLQAVAAVGQVHLMGLYEKALKQHGYDIAQILLTRADLNSRISYRNAAMTFKRLLDWGVVPVVNENDTLSAEELRYGDNDTLSALVATAVSADQLILLTDVDRLYSSDPRHNAEAQPISDIHHPRELLPLELTNKAGGHWGTGGIKTKLTSARIATASGITVQLADGRNPQMLGKLLAGARGGTVFHPHPSPIGTKKSWLAHALKPLGAIHLDDGACDAIQNRGASVLLVGVEKTEGDFSANQPVKIINTSGQEIARGISSLSSDFLKESMKKSRKSSTSPVVIHRDVLVLSKELIM